MVTKIESFKYCLSPSPIMRGLVLFLIILAVMVSFSFIVLSLGNSNNKKIENKDQSKITEFSTFTSAVCEAKENVVECRDEVFVKCNGTVSKATDIAECNGLKIDVPKAIGFATFGKEWKDPRV